jgi:hypothetical protein
LIGPKDTLEIKTTGHFFLKTLHLFGDKYANEGNLSLICKIIFGYLRRQTGKEGKTNFTKLFLNKFVPLGYFKKP